MTEPADTSPMFSEEREFIECLSAYKVLSDAIALARPAGIEVTWPDSAKTLRTEIERRLEFLGRIIASRRRRSHESVEREFAEDHAAIKK